jgi:predicted ATPase
VSNSFILREDSSLRMFFKITTMFSAKLGDLIIIESPEPRLHPSGPANLGEPIARSAKGAIQLIILFSSTMQEAG